jgi:hypothetical protein
MLMVLIFKAGFRAYAVRYATEIDGRALDATRPHSHMTTQTLTPRRDEKAGVYRTDLACRMQHGRTAHAARVVRELRSLSACGGDPVPVVRFRSLGRGG